MSNQRTLEDILNEYEKAEKLSKKDRDSVDASVRAGFEISIRRAKDALPGLRTEYTTKIMKNAVGFFLQGTAGQVKAFSDAAVAEGAVDLDASALFESLADAVQPSIGGRREFSVTQVGLLDHALREICEKAGYKGQLGRTNISSLRVVQNRQKLVDYIRELVTASNGSVPSTLSAQSTITAKALKSKFKDKRLVVVVRNASSVDRAPVAGLFSKTITIDIDPEAKVDAGFARNKIMEAFKSTTKSASASTKAPEKEPPVNQTENQPTQE